MADNDRSLSNRNRSGLSNERGIPHNSLSLDAFYQKAKATANRFVVGLKEYFDFLVHGDAEIQGDVSVGGDTTITGDLDVTGEITGNYLMDNDTKANLDSADFTYPLGQRVLENDTNSTKTGDNSTGYESLPYDYGYQKLESGSISTTGWYTIAETEDTANINSSGSFAVSIVNKSHSLGFEVACYEGTTAKDHTNTTVEIIKKSGGTAAGVRIDGVRLAKSDSVNGSGNKVQVYLTLGSASVIKTVLTNNNGGNGGFKLVTPVLEASPTLPDGVTSATFLEAGEEYRVSLTASMTIPDITWHKINANSIRLVFAWGEIPKQNATNATLSYTALIVRDGSGTSYTFDTTETVAFSAADKKHVALTITKTSAFTSLTQGGNDVQANALIVTLS